MGNGAKIDYRLRPAKHVERKMIVRALGRLNHFDSLEHYQYVGFGALYFRDFRLVHQLGVEALTSIESEQNIERYEANKPYKAVEVRGGTASRILPLLNWDGRSIVWLDYTGLLGVEELSDIGFAASEIQTGSVLITTVTVRSDGGLDGRAERLVKRVGGKESMPRGEIPDDMDLSTARKMSEWVRRIIKQRIDAKLRERNVGKNLDDCYCYKQLFNFHYADGQEMLTVGGVIYQGKEKDKLGAAEFDSLPFVKSEAEAYRIPTPLLTSREILALDAKLPAAAGSLRLPGVPSDDVDGYGEVYRYFPRFVDADF